MNSENTSFIKTIQSTESSLAGIANTQLCESAFVSNKPTHPTKPFKASLVAKWLEKTLETNIPPGQDNRVKNQFSKLESKIKSFRKKT